MLTQIEGYFRAGQPTRYLPRSTVVGFRREPEGGARFSPRVGTAPRPSAGRRSRNDARAKDYPGEGWFAGARQAARQRQPSLQDDGLQPGQLLPLQGAVRQRWRAGAAGDQPPQAGVKEPHTDRDRTGGGRPCGRAARWGPGADVRDAQAARDVDLAGRSALRVAAPRSDRDETSPQ